MTEPLPSPQLLEYQSNTTSLESFLRPSQYHLEYYNSRFVLLHILEELTPQQDTLLRIWLLDRQQGIF